MNINDESYVSNQILDAMMGDEYAVKTFLDQRGNDFGWCVVDSSGNEVTSLTTDYDMAEMDCYDYNGLNA